jgi:hypothetical protein
MKNRQFKVAGVLFMLLASLVPLTAQAGGSSFSITELNPQIRTLTAGKNNQLVKELEVSLYNTDISSLNDMEFDVACNGDDVFKNVTVGQDTKTLGSAEFKPPITILLESGETYQNSAMAHVKTTGSEIKNGTDEKFWVKMNIADTDKSTANVCNFFNFTFTEKSTGTVYDSGWSFEEVASNITPLVVIGSTKSGPVKDALEVSMKKLGQLTYKLGSQNQTIYMADVTANQDLTIDDVLFSCQDSNTIKSLKLKDQTAQKVLATEVIYPGVYVPEANGTYTSPIQSVFFKNLNWQIRGGSTRQLNILADFGTMGWAVGYDHGCSVMAINAHIIDPTNTSKNISIHPTQIPGIGLKYQTSPLDISQDFIDISKDDSLYDAVTYLRNAYIIDGYADGMFRPLSKINRAEFAQMITKVKTQGVLTEYDVNCSKAEDPKFFSDVTKSVWYNLPVCYSLHMGYIKGYADGIKMALKVIDVSVEEPASGPWYTPYIEPAQTRGLLSADPNLSHPDEEITRGEMATILYRALNPQLFQTT